MAGRVANKIALVTGAASGLGAEAARRLAAEGALVMLTDRDPAVADIAAAIGDRADYAIHDVAIEADWEAVVARTTERFGRLGILVNNAGVAGGNLDLLSHSLEAWRHILSINLDGVFLGLRHCGPVMAAKGGGSIINLSSILGKVGLPGAAAYCASKGGVTLLTKAAALEWAPLGIRVNSVHPGFIDTPMVSGALHAAENGNEMRDMLIAAHPMARFGAPREIADTIVFLASDESSFMTGAEIVVDGGYTAR